MSTSTDDTLRQGIKVPFGLSPKGQEVHAKDASRDTVYRCPSCKAELLLKRGEIRRPHFAHLHEPDACEFVYETEEHYRAKHWINEAWESGEQLRLRRQCSTCRSTLSQDLRAGQTAKVEIEYLLDTGHRADVALLNVRDELLAVIEIYSTHRVDPEKANAMKSRGIQWGEFHANEVLDSTHWRPFRDEFAPSVCAPCKQEAHEAKLIEQFGVVNEFADKKRMKVPCPLKTQGIVPVFAACMVCEHYIDSRPNGVFCLGRRELAGGGHCD